MSNCKRSAMTVLYIQDERTKEEGGGRKRSKITRIWQANENGIRGGNRSKSEQVESINPTNDCY